MTVSAPPQPHRPPRPTPPHRAHRHPTAPTHRNKHDGDVQREWTRVVYGRLWSTYTLADQSTCAIDWPIYYSEYAYSVVGHCPTNLARQCTALRVHSESPLPYTTNGTGKQPTLIIDLVVWLVDTVNFIKMTALPITVKMLQLGLTTMNTILVAG